MMESEKKLAVKIRRRCGDRELLDTTFQTMWQNQKKGFLSILFFLSNITPCIFRYNNAALLKQRGKDVVKYIKKSPLTALDDNSLKVNMM